MNAHVLDDLELYAVSALDEASRDRVDAHLGVCDACRIEAERLAAVVDFLPDFTPSLEPTPALRQRILASARAEVAPAARRETIWTIRRLRFATLAALVGLVALIAAADARLLQAIDGTARERDELSATLEEVSRAGRSWYMEGQTAHQGSGGTLVASETGRAFVLFHDLKPSNAGTRYAVWLIAEDGQRWVRAATFDANGEPYQRVDLGIPVVNYQRCAVTMEKTDDSRPLGGVVMESRIAPAAQ